MAGLTIAIEPHGFKEAERALAGIKNGFPKAAARAINDGVKTGRTLAVKMIRQPHNVKAADLKEQGIRMDKAKGGNLTGALRAVGSMLPVALFKAKKKMKASRRGGRQYQYVTAAIIKGKAKVIKGAFMLNDGRVMERRQPDRTPIFPVSTIGVPQMIKQIGIGKAVEQKISETTQKRLAHYTQLFLSKGKAPFPMTIFQLEDALVEWVGMQTDELRLQSNESTTELAQPSVWSGYIPRDEVGAILPGEISSYPVIVVSAQSGNQDDPDSEVVTVAIVIGCYDAGLDQQGYRDCVNLVQLLKDRFNEYSIIRQRFPVRLPITWKMNPRSAGPNAFPYFFAEMTVNFEIEAASSQFETTLGTGDYIVGPYDNTPIPTPEPNEHWKHATPPPIKIIDHDLRWPPAPPPEPEFPITP